MKRTCGDCQACCTTFKVPEVNKAEGEACKHLVKAGCGIHRIRPNVCRHYECAWLQGLLKLEEDDRPDKSGVILSLAPEDNEVRRRLGIYLIIAQETKPGSFGSTEAQRVISKVATKYVVVRRIGAQRTIMGPEALVDKVYDILNEISQLN